MGNAKSVRKITDSHKLPLIVQAASDGQRDRVRLFIKHKHDVNSTCPMGFTPLMAASVEGHTEVVALLLSKGKSPLLSLLNLLNEV